MHCRVICSWMLSCCLIAARVAHAAEDLAQWTPQPADWKGAVLADGKATLAADKWSYLMAPQTHQHAELAATVTILEAAKQFRFFGDGWSAWPDPQFGDAGFEFAALLRSGVVEREVEGKKLTENFGYRVQLSHKYQSVALVKYPEGGYVRVAACAVKLNQPIAVVAKVVGADVIVTVDGQEKIRFSDRFLPLTAGQCGVGVSSNAKVRLDDVRVSPVAGTTAVAATAGHQPSFAMRRWLGDRQWVFDGDEPILQLHNARDPSCFAKFKPGYKPQITFDSHWGLENQGAFPDAASQWTEPVVSGSGSSIKAQWSARNVKDRFTTASTLTVRFDEPRGMYAYEIDSQLEVLPGEPFHFRYGFDFEHHTPLDPFRWQYLIAKRRNGDFYHRPVYPIDPGPQNDLDMLNGSRVWFGRHLETQHVAPAIEYFNSPADIGERQCNTAVCAAFYDTGVSFAPETSKPGTKLRVRYRYTGYPVSEAKQLFEQSKIYDSPTLDPKHHYIFADEWPKLTFSQHLPLSQSWIYGRTPFMTAHNTRPTYELERTPGTGSGFAMKLGAASFGKANLPVGTDLKRGRWLVSALVKSVNTHGPGGRLELEASQAKTNKIVASARHFVGNGSFDWQRQSFLWEIPEDAAALSVAFGNAGTGDVLFTDVEFKRLNDGDAVPSGTMQRPREQAPSFGSSFPGAIADYRMQEGRGLVVLNYATPSPFGHLDLANVDWVTDSGRPAIRLAENTTGRQEFRRDSGLYRSYLSHPGYAGKETLPVALTGHHGGGGPMKGLTLAAWIKPAAEMGAGTHKGRGDIIGFGARRFIMSLTSQQPPYPLTAVINVNDSIPSTAKLEADRWYHVAMTAEPHQGQWRVRLFVDGESVGEGQTTKFPGDSSVVPSLILGAEIFYLHSSYYRGLIGHTLVFERALSVEEIRAVMK